MTLPQDARAMLDRLSLAELKEMQDAVAIKVREKQDAEKANAKAELERIARSKGFSIDDLFGNGSAKPAKPKSSVPPKYRHPDEPNLTWAGRGRKPKWVIEALEAGKTLDDLLI